MGLENLGLAFVLTMLAGLSTSIGGLIALFAKRTNTDFLSFAWGFGRSHDICCHGGDFCRARLAAVNVWGTAGLWVATAAFSPV